MRTLQACAYVAITALAVACGGDGDAKPDARPIVVPDAPPIVEPDAPPLPDAQQFDFSCMGNTAPTTAAPTVTITGSTNDINVAQQSLEPVAGAVVKAFKSGTPDLELGNTVSDANGDWTLSNVPTAGLPVDGYVEARKEGHRTLRLYPPAPITEDIPQAPLLLFSNATFGVILQFTGNAQSAANGTAGVAVLDCANTPISGATITVTQGGVEVGTQEDLSQLQPGTFLVFDVPPGETVVGATFNGMTLRSHTITVLAQTTSTTAVRPGF